MADDCGPGNEQTDRSEDRIKFVVGETFKIGGKRPCPKCGENLDASTAVTDGEGGPEPGVITICAYCLSTLIFTDDMQLRFATKEDEKDYQPGTFAELDRLKLAIMQSRKKMWLPDDAG